MRCTCLGEGIHKFASSSDSMDSSIVVNCAICGMQLEEMHVHDICWGLVNEVHMQQSTHASVMVLTNFAAAGTSKETRQCCAKCMRHVECSLNT